MEHFSGNLELPRFKVHQVGAIYCCVLNPDDTHLLHKGKYHCMADL